MKVHISSRWYAKKEDAELLQEKQRSRWLQNIDTKDWMKDAYTTRIPCTSPIDVTLDLPLGRYCFGYGDKNIESPSTGRMIYERVYFTVDANGAIVYKWSELPTLESLVEESRKQPTLSVEEDSEESDFIEIDKIYCMFDGEIYPLSHSCAECRPKESGIDSCDICEFKDKLYRKMKLTN